MFNLLVKGNGWSNGRDTLSESRIFEYTEEHLVERFRPKGKLDFAALMAYPCLFVEEASGDGNQVVRVGTILRARKTGYDISLDYSYDSTIPPLTNKILKGLSVELGIADFQFHRTHWSVKDEDLYRALLLHVQPRRPKPKVFQVSDPENIEPSLVSAMMPFNPSFDSVYKALKRTATAAGFRCRRADDIWENPAVIQDVVSLIDRSCIVICDCTGRNPNVFYEIGIAHTLGREVILITQSEADIPFDLRHLRYVPYLNNREGLKALCTRLLPRLNDLALGEAKDA